MSTIQLTEKAKEHIKKLIAKENGLGFRLSIKKTGCSGYSYVPSIVTTINANDFKLEDEFAIYLDSNYVNLLNDITIDLQEENSTGLKQKKLVFGNPREAARCGCGESFQISEDEDANAQ